MVACELVWRRRQMEAIVPQVVVSVVLAAALAHAIWKLRLFVG
jgi:hypothetical protein